MNTLPKFENPFKPGAGHKPPYLAGRSKEKEEFEELLAQTTILENAVLTGLRGVGKTVLLEELKAIAITSDWLWAGNDLSESTSVEEQKIAVRLIADLSVLTSICSFKDTRNVIGFTSARTEERSITYETLMTIYKKTPGLPSDKLKEVLVFSWDVLQQTGKRGVVFAYDEAQNMSDHAARHEFPLSLILDVFQSIQRKGIPYMLVLTGLPTLFPKLVDARTYAERMFRVVFLSKLSETESKDAIRKPIQEKKCPVSFAPESIDEIVRASGGYPYFIQFICREVFDIFLQHGDQSQGLNAPMEGIMRKLDKDFFAGRWLKVTDRQKELLTLVANLNSTVDEFSVLEAVEASRQTEKSFSSSHVNQMLTKLIENGIVFKNRHGKYSFAVPLLDQFIRRQQHIDGDLYF